MFKNVKFLLGSLALAAVLVTGCESSGESCSEVGAYRCNGNVVQLCRYDASADNFWESRTDCAASSTSNCECVIAAGMGLCGVNGSSDNLCQGQSL